MRNLKKKKGKKKKRYGTHNNHKRYTVKADTDLVTLVCKCMQPTNQFYERETRKLNSIIWLKKSLR